MDLKELRKALGLADSIPDADVITTATERATAAKAAEDAKAAAEAKALNLSRDLDTARNELTRRPAPRTPQDKEALHDRSELTLSRIDLMVDRGDIPEVLGKKLRASVKNEAGEPNEFMLSRADGLDKRPIDWVMSLFDGAKLGIECNRKVGVADPPNHYSLDRDGTQQTDPAAQMDEGRKAGEDFQARSLKARGLQPLA